MGITPYDNQSSIGMFYRYRSFSGYNIADQSPVFFPGGRVAVPLSTLHDPNGNNPGTVPVYSGSDYEIYNVYELRSKYFIHKRTELNLVLPFNDNRIKYSDVFTELKSIGDISIIAGFHVLRQIETEKKIQQRLILGTGIKLPTGKSDFKTEDNTRYNILIQPGTGSTDYLFYLNYTAAGSTLGIGINSVYKACTENAYSEKYTNSINSSAGIFYKLYRSNWQLIPSLQFYYEYVKGIKDHGALVPNTGSDIGMLGPAIDVYYKNVSLNFIIQYPVHDKTDSENLSAAGKMVAGLKYNFNQRNYLIHKKASPE
jgi:hypothetical protein